MAHPCFQVGIFQLKQVFLERKLFVILAPIYS